MALKYSRVPVLGNVMFLDAGVHRISIILLKKIKFTFQQELNSSNEKNIRDLGKSKEKFIAEDFLFYF